MGSRICYYCRFLLLLILVLRYIFAVDTDCILSESYVMRSKSFAENTLVIRDWFVCHWYDIPVFVTRLSTARLFFVVVFFFIYIYFLKFNLHH